MHKIYADTLPSLSSTHPINGHTSPPPLDHTPAKFPHLHLKHSVALTDKTSCKDSAAAAKHKISAKLREDWIWPPLSEIEGLNTGRDVAEWRARESAPSYSPEPGSGHGERDPYRYDTPESLSAPIVSRKRKRRERLSEELSWNDGLRTYTARRDAWSGARSISQPALLNNDQPNGYWDLSSTKKLPSTTPTLPICPPSPLIPLAPPLIDPTNPTRASITPHTYPSIYNKVVIEGLTPTIPISLCDVVGALVDGWKRDGDWPPKQEAEETARSNRGATRMNRGGGKRLAKKGVGKVKKVLGLGSEEETEGLGQE